MAKREVIRFLRQRSRIAGALGTPIVFWFFIGSGIGGSYQTIPGTDYLHYFFPGILVLIVLFAAIFSTISIIEDRQAGFLQGVLVTSSSRASIVLGKMVGGTLLALIQGLLFMAFIFFLDMSLSLKQMAFIFFNLTIMALGLTGLGFLIAWRMSSTQGFHAIMTLFLMPMWFLSGAVFPLATAPSWLKTLMMINPLTYSMASLHHGFFSGFETNIALPQVWVFIGVPILFAISTFFLSLISVKRSQ